MNSLIILRLSLVIFILSMTSKFFSQAIYVKQDASGTNDGSSWQNAYTDLEAALNAASDNSELWVAAGIYHPGGLIPDINSVFAIHHNISIYGGFAGTEVNLEERDPLGNPTILSGDINNNDITDNFTDNKSDNTHHVVYVDSLLNLVVIDGITVKGGNTLDSGNASVYDRSGGGIYAMSPVMLNQCHLTENFGREGGGIYWDSRGSASSVINCIFSHNKTTQRGAGLYALRSDDILISHCAFTDNKTERGAVSPAFCNNLIVENCLFQDNHTSAFNGGAFFSFQNTDLLLRKCNFIRNSAIFGGAIVINGAQLPQGILSNDRIEYCYFQENRASEDAGTIYCLTNPDILIMKCDFMRDSAKSGGAVLIEQPAINQTDTNKIRIDSCLFVGNFANDKGGGALRLKFTSAKIENCKFLNNSTEGLLDGGGGHVYQVCPNKYIIYRNDSLMNGVSKGYGGAVLSLGLNAHYLFENCFFGDNLCYREGGAVHNALASISMFKYCSFKKNGSNEDGGALGVAHDSTTVYAENSTFIENQAAGDGGAIISNGGSCILSLINCRLDSNQAVAGFGGAIFIVETGNDNISSLTLNNSMFGFNSSTIQAGAVNIVDTDTHITSCLFYENTCADQGVGGALAIKATDEDTMEATIINTTFVNNHGFFADGIAQETQSINAALTTKIQNCIFRNQGFSNYVIEAGTPVLLSNGGNMSDDESMVDVFIPKDLNNTSPVFYDETNFDFSLTPNSPGIDAGILQGAPEFDILGNPRVNAPDMGAYENQFPVAIKETNFQHDGTLVISPNPVSGGSTNLLMNNSWRGPLEIRIVNVNGETLMTQNIHKTSETYQFSLPIESLSPAVYHVVVSDGKQIITIKMLRI